MRMPAAVPSPVPSAATLLSHTFDHRGVTAARHVVSACAAAAGLVGSRLSDFVFAVNELVTNVVRHAGGRGQLRLSRRAGVLRCEVVDEGPGIPSERLNPDTPPPRHATGGRGLWLVRHLCDRVTIRTGETGTSVLVEMRLSPSTT